MKALFSPLAGRRCRQADEGWRQSPGQCRPSSDLTRTQSGIGHLLPVNGEKELSFRSPYDQRDQP